MQLSIESPHLHAGAKLQQLIIEKFSHLDRIFHLITEGQVTLRVQGDDRQQNCWMDARLIVPGDVLFASKQAHSFELALPELVDSLAHQLHRYKDSRSY